MIIIEAQRNQKLEVATDEIKSLYASPQSGEVMYEVFTTNQVDVALYQTYATIIGDVILGFYKTTELPQLLQTELGVSETIARQITADLLEFLSPVVARETAGAGVKKTELESLAASIGRRTPSESTPAVNQPPLSPTPTPVAHASAVDPAPAVTAHTARLTEVTQPVTAAPIPENLPVNAVPTPAPAPAAADAVTPPPSSAFVSDAHAAPTTPEVATTTPPVAQMRTMQTDMNRIHGYGAFRDAHPDTEPVHKAADQDNLLNRS